MLTKEDKKWMLQTIDSVAELKAEEKVKEAFFKKTKREKFLEFIRAGLTPAIMVSGIAFVTFYYSNMEGRIFKDASEKEQILNKYSELPDPIVLHQIGSHVTDPGIHMAREDKDSIYLTRKENEMYQKSTSLYFYDLNKVMKKMIDDNESFKREVRNEVRSIKYLLNELKENQ